MKQLRIIGVMVCTFLIFSCATVHLGEIGKIVPEETKQLLLVDVPAWLSTTATMFLYERSDVTDNWKAIDSFPVNIGNGGLAWDNNTPIQKYGSQRVKHEGDGCSPAGIFTLGTVFGYAGLEGLKMPYITTDKYDICVDDFKSQFYNTHVRTDSVVQDWNSFEYLKRNDGLYKYGIWVNYNANPVVEAAGSCIFLHIQQGEGLPTSGCTSMPGEKLLELIHWLDNSKNPVLIQLVPNRF